MQVSTVISLRGFCTWTYLNLQNSSVKTQRICYFLSDIIVFILIHVFQYQFNASSDFPNNNFLFLLIPVSQLEILKHDYERLHLQLQEQNQKFTAADVERINREKRELQLTLSSLTKTLEEAEQHKWNEEIALAKAKERVSVNPAWTANPLPVDFSPNQPASFLFYPQEEAKLSEYHKVARKLQLIPVSAKNACGHDFEISQVNCGSGSAVQHNTETQVCVCSSKKHS